MARPIPRDAPVTMAAGRSVVKVLGIIVTRYLCMKPFDFVDFNHVLAMLDHRKIVIRPRHSAVPRVGLFGSLSPADTLSPKVNQLNGKRNNVLDLSSLSVYTYRTVILRLDRISNR